jgi:hypothetical protein
MKTIPLLALSRAAVVGVVTLAGTALPLALAAQDAAPAPNRAEGEGPFDRLIIRGATLIDGTGAPPRGPVDIVIERNRIAQVVDVGFPGLPINQSRRPRGPAREIQAEGHFVLPGLIDLHVHTGGVPKAPEAEYVYKLWMAHGVTTVRGVPFGGFEWSLREKERSAKNEITAPRLVSCHRMGTGSGWQGGAIRIASSWGRTSPPSWPPSLTRRSARSWGRRRTSRRREWRR